MVVFFFFFLFDTLVTAQQGMNLCLDLVMIALPLFFSQGKSITVALAEWAAAVEFDRPTAGHYCVKCTLVQNSQSLRLG